jgi:hypothetical protein
MDVDLSWSFNEYQAYERARLNESLAEQRRARADGLEVDPKGEFSFTMANVWRIRHRDETRGQLPSVASPHPGGPLAGDVGRSGLADRAGEPGDEQGGKRPGQQL